MPAIAALALLGACASPAGPTAPPTRPAPAGPTTTPPPTATQFTPGASPTPAEGAGQLLLTEKGRWFAASGVCGPCHSGLKDSSGADVSIDTHWRASLEANAGRDPFFQASVRAAVLGAPQDRAAIEDACAACHMPMARFSAAASGDPVAILDDGFLDPTHEFHALALDGVSCTLCHQIREQGLGLPGSYNGGYSIDRELPEGQRLSFGPYSVDEDQSALMQQTSGYIPTTSLHVIQPELCATCHTYYSGPSGVAAPGEGFPLLTTYLEWFESDYYGGDGCRGCHMPEAEGGVHVASTAPHARSPFAQHTFTGPNTYILQMLKTFGDELGATASEPQFEAAVQRGVELLQNQTASMTIRSAIVSSGRLSVDLAVESQVGHKFPSGFPSARAWIHLVVRDANGGVVFESGGVNPDGSIRGNDGDETPGGFEPHYLAVVDPGQVQIYEAVLRGRTGGVTTDILQATGYVKDNRLLPTGFDLEAQPADIAVRGRAADDPDFLDGSDGVEYLVDLGGAPGPYEVTVELLYQSVGSAWVEALRGAEGPEPARFLGFYDALPNLPVIVTQDVLLVEG